MSGLDELAWRLAAKQYGLIGRRQALDLGFSTSAIQRRRARGQWLTPQPSVYFMNGSPFTWHTRVLAACLSVDGVASHRTAAVQHTVRDFWRDVPEITIPRGRQLDRTDLRIHESTDLHLVEPVLIAGIPTSSPARLAADLGAVVPFHVYEPAVDDLIARKLLSWDEALHSLMLHSKKGRNGVGALRLLLEQRYGEDVAESVLERVFRRRFESLRIPPPVPQVEVFDENGFIARVDYAYPELLIAIELDSRRYHFTGDGFEADPRKRNRLTLAGWLVLEYTWKRVIDQPEGVYGEIVAGYDERTAMMRS